MAITLANLGVSAAPDLNDNVDRTSYATASWTPPTSGLILVGIWSRNAAGPNTPTVSGNGITWTEVLSQLHATVLRYTLFAALAAGSSAGATTFDFAGQTQLLGIATFFHADGVDLSGGVAGAIVQSVAATHISTNSAPTVTLAAAGHADNRPILIAGVDSNTTPTPRANWTEVDVLAGTTPNHTIESQFRTDAFETTAGVTWAVSGNGILIAAELKADQGGAPAAEPPPANPWYSYAQQ